MKFLKSLFLFGFIVLHSSVTGKPIWLKTEYIASVFDSVKGTSVWTVGQIDSFVVKESFDTVTNMIAESK